MKSPDPLSGERNPLEKLLPNVPRGTSEALLRYIDLVFAWNLKVNLTGAKSRQTFIEEHIFDCVAAWQALSEKTALIDVGTGAGLPGVVWALLDSSIPMVLLDASLKRTAFLQRLRSELELKNTQILAKRFEDLSEEDLLFSVPTWDLVSRGTATPRDLLQLAGRCRFSWRGWYIFSNEKIHAEYLTQAPPLGVKVEKIFYQRFSRQGEVGRPGILTLLRKPN